ncbi:hypothetical protein LCGC14_0224430 [marine sediment metagenome]|uniref:Uncharacterized protein n=1 Tax=marine sediment metagenome TaxID=412755 RepID=A0A0F9UGT0_9ZZZZ
MTMEINISIKLEDGDIALLIQSIFELIKRIPQEKVQVNIDPNAKPDLNTGTAPIRINDYEQGTAVDIDKIHYNNSGEPYGWDAETTKAPSKNNTTSEDIYYSNDGSTVKKIDNEQKKNEE